MSIFSSSIPVVDLFAGPGGLGEGFSSLNDGKAFEIRVSAEKDPIARETLRLRSFYRLLKNHRRDCLQDYYRYCNGEAEQAFTEKTIDLWEKAGLEAMSLEIGSESGNQRLDQAGAFQKQGQIRLQAGRRSSALFVQRVSADYSKKQAGYICHGECQRHSIFKDKWGFHFSSDTARSGKPQCRIGYAR